MYESVCPIASGGMAVVELVLRREGTFARPYARKRLLADAPEMRDMFVEEGRVAGLLRHPNVVGVLDVGHDERGPFLIMEYVEGVTLQQVLKQRASRLPLQIALRIFLQVCEGLAAAHALRDPSGQNLGLVHRDISPSNILLDLHGMVRLNDFGIARATGRSFKTSTGVVKGKLGYLAPEVLRFERPTQAADLFALGVTAY